MVAQRRSSRPRKENTSRRSKTGLPKNLADAIRRAWPNGVVDMPVDSDDAPFWDIYRELRASLSRIPGSTEFYEREPEDELESSRGPDADEDALARSGGSLSYHVFFLSPQGDRFQFETDTIEPDEDGVEQRYQGEGRIGCVVGVSLVAPFAVIMFDERAVFENGSRSEPDVEPHIFTLDGRRRDLDEDYREMVDEEGVAILRTLRTKIVSVLDDFEISVIPEEDLDRPVPSLRAGGDAFVGNPVTVREAFFFRGP